MKNTFATSIWLVALASALGSPVGAQDRPRVQFISVEKTLESAVKLEVLDWGGAGRPLILLGGLGDSAHVYESFAPRLAAHYHVYGITRRGFGSSTAPDPSVSGAYSADRLGDDVVAVIDALKLNRPVLAAHSIGGEELSSVASRHPAKVAGLIYLDAAYSYAFYDSARGDWTVDLVELRNKLDQLLPGKGAGDPVPLIRDLLASTLPRFERDLREMQSDLEGRPAAARDSQSSVAIPAAAQAVLAGQRKYTSIPLPVLAIYALPHDVGLTAEAERAAFEARDRALTGAQAEAFEKGVPTARVVRLPHAGHYVFRSNEEDVLREMTAFIESLQ